VEHAAALARRGVKSAAAIPSADPRAVQEGPRGTDVACAGRVHSEFLRRPTPAGDRRHPRSPPCPECWCSTGMRMPITTVQ
jgi:hypothetical protein